jgi:zinc D-Ala-D-Ala dipeptidase
VSSPSLRRVTSHSNGQQAEKRYWAEQMEAAHAFMLSVRAHPVRECEEPVARIDVAAARSGVDMAFSDLPHANGGPRVYLLRETLIDDLLAVAEALNAHGFRLVVEDGFRTREMQRLLAQTPHVIRRVVERTVWETDSAQPPLELLVRRLGALVAASPKVGTHMSATAVDVSVVDRSTGRELDRGGGYLEISERTPMASPFTTPAEREARELITAQMVEQGFVAYPFEFWHYSKGDAFHRVLSNSPGLAPYGAVDIDRDTGSVTAIPNPTDTLNHPDDLAPLLERAARDLARSAAQSAS